MVLEIVRRERRLRVLEACEVLPLEGSSTNKIISRKRLRSSETKNSEEYTPKIRLGRNYQATITAFIPPSERIVEISDDKDDDNPQLLIWSPPAYEKSKSKFDKYMRIAKMDYGYNEEQALGLLLIHEHNVQDATVDLSKFVPYMLASKLTSEEKVLFAKAIKKHGKNFRQIHKSLPNKSIANLVEYYYSRDRKIKPIRCSS